MKGKGQLKSTFIRKTPGRSPHPKATPRTFQMKGLRPRQGVHTASWGGGGIKRSQSRKGNILWGLPKPGEIDSLVRRARQPSEFQLPYPGYGLEAQPSTLHSGPAEGPGS